MNQPGLHPPGCKLARVVFCTRAPGGISKPAGRGRHSRDRAGTCRRRQPKPPAHHQSSPTGGLRGQTVRGLAVPLRHAGHLPSTGPSHHRTANGRGLWLWTGEAGPWPFSHRLGPQGLFLSSCCCSPDRCGDSHPGLWPPTRLYTHVQGPWSAHPSRPMSTHLCSPIASSLAQASHACTVRGSWSPKGVCGSAVAHLGCVSLGQQKFVSGSE